MKQQFNILLLLFSIAGFSQFKISGYVTNSNQQKLSGVIVHVLENNTETTTDENGYFQLASVPKGTTEVIFQRTGFQTKKEVIKTNGDDIILNVMLLEKEIHLEEVIISTLYNKIQSQNVMKVEHASVKTLKENGATSLIEGIATIPGVSQISTGNSIGKPVIRGLSGNRVLVYSQGVRMENQQFGEEHGLGLNAAGIESVEVIKGPASLLYGSDALGGVVYFNSEKYAPYKEKSADFEQSYFTNTQGTSTTFGVKASPSNFKFLLRGNYTSHADYEVPNGDRIINTRFIEKDFKSGIGYSNSKIATDFRYNYNNLNLGLPEEDIENSGFRNPLFPKQEIANHLLSLNQKVYFKNSKIEADFGYSLNDRKELEAPDEIALSMKLKTASYTVKYFVPKINRWETIIGIQGMDQTNTNFGEELLIPDAKVTDFGAFATTNYSWNSNVLQAGIRYDNRKINTSTHGTEGEEGYFEAINKQFNSFNASLGYKTNLSSSISTRINIASGFRAPNLSELTSNGVHEGSNRYEIGNTELKNEQNFQVDINLEYKSEHLEWFANGFYNSVSNYIFITPSGTEINGNAVYNYVQNNSYLFGGEAGIHFHPHPFDWLHFTSSFESVTGIQGTNNLPLIPANQWKNNIRAELNSNQWIKNNYVSCFLNYNFKQDNVSEFETSTPDYLLINLSLGGTITIGKKVVQLNLTGTNLLNKTYVNHLSRLKADGINNMGRNIMLRLNFDL
ncbi:TonB-dependent receptor domain-containing protein [Flavobacterium sp.]|jgi:iron complex outermembrane receptor protein|uniref:TonB-dependent receptor n=1 Tax=Flavobacterium sp. TaxID=239 RepID=UPI0037BE9BD7